MDHDSGHVHHATSGTSTSDTSDFAGPDWSLFGSFGFGDIETTSDRSLPQSPSAWVETARRLGLGVRVPLGQWNRTWPFLAIVRLLSPFWTQGQAVWLHGRRRGTEVVIAPFGVFQPPYVAVVVRIDRALFRGLLAQRDSSSPRGWSVASFSREYGHALLGNHHPSNDLQRALEICLPRGVTITDSSVVLPVAPGGELGPALDFGVWLAGGLVERNVSLPPSEADRALEAVWQSFADERGLSFDRLRRHLHGVIDGYRLSLFAGSSATALFTEVAIGWPRDLGFVAHGATSLAATTYETLPQRPLSLGVATEEDPFVLRGDDAAYAGGFLAKRAVRPALVALARDTNEISIHGTGANWVTSGLSQRGELELAVEHALSLARAMLDVEIPARAPYR